MLKVEQFQKILNFSTQCDICSSSFRQQSLELLDQDFGYDKSVFHRIDDNGHLCPCAAHNITESGQKRYEKYRINDFFAPAEYKNSIPQKRVYTITDFMSFEEYERTQHFDILQQEGLYHQALLQLRFQRRPVAAVAVYHASKQILFSNEELMTLDLIAQQLEWMLRFQNNWYEAVQKLSEAEIWKGIYSVLDTPMLLCDESLHVKNFNTAAEKFLIQNCSLPYNLHDIDKFIWDNVMQRYIASHENEMDLTAIPGVRVSIQNFVVQREHDEKRFTPYYTVKFSMNKNASKNWKMLMIRNGLTTREQEICTMCLDGISNDDLATRLTIRTSTLKKHLNNIFRKMNISRRSELFALFLHQVGLK